MTSDPIILVGMQRSGTTWMGRMFGARPDIAYWPEPRQVWSFGHWFRGDDRLDAADATPRVARHIQRRFRDYTTSRGKTRFAEKTPSNVVRLPFVRAVFPEARILLVVRDGRSVVRSSNQIRESGVEWRRLRDRVKESSILDWPGYVTRLPWLVDKVRGRPIKFWGVRPPGWQKWAEHDSPLVAMAKQWAESIRYAVTDGRAMSPDRFLEVRYEALTVTPRETMQRIVDFFALPAANDLIARAVADADPARQNKWRTELSPEILSEIRPHMEGTLRWLGYEW